MKIICNGDAREIAEGASIAALLAELKLQGPIAVEVNRKLAPREEHESWLLQDGDELEIVTLVGGG